MYLLKQSLYVVFQVVLYGVLFFLVILAISVFSESAKPVADRTYDENLADVSPADAAAATVTDSAPALAIPEQPLEVKIEASHCQLRDGFSTLNVTLRNVSDVEIRGLSMTATFKNGSAINDSAELHFGDIPAGALKSALALSAIGGSSRCEVESLTNEDGNRVSVTD